MNLHNIGPFKRFTVLISLHVCATTAPDLWANHDADKKHKEAAAAAAAVSYADHFILIYNDE